MKTNSFTKERFLKRFSNASEGVELKSVDLFRSNARLTLAFLSLQLGLINTHVYVGDLGESFPSMRLEGRTKSGETTSVFLIVREGKLVFAYSENQGKSYSIEPDPELLLETLTLLICQK